MARPHPQRRSRRRAWPDLGGCWSCPPPTRFSQNLGCRGARATMAIYNSRGDGGHAPSNDRRCPPSLSCVSGSAQPIARIRNACVGEAPAAARPRRSRVRTGGRATDRDGGRAPCAARQPRKKVRDAALPSQDPQRVRQRGLQESRVRKEGGGNGRRQRAGFLCGATAGKKSQRRRVAKPRASHGLKAVGGLARSRRERWAAEWDSGTASRAPMPASRQPTASRFLGSVVRGFVPLLQLTRRPLRDILLQPCDDIPLGFFHGAGIGGGLAALSDRCCWGASGRAGR